jgi:hypothetical protein
MSGHYPGCCSQCFFVWRFGISIDGVNPPTPVQLLLPLAIQLMVQCWQSLACNLWFEVVERQPTMSVPLLRMRSWSVIVTLMAVSQWCNAVSVALPRAVGRLANSNAGWVFLTSEVSGQMNMSSLCARFPDAAFFADYADCPPSQ